MSNEAVFEDLAQQQSTLGSSLQPEDDKKKVTPYRSTEKKIRFVGEEEEEEEAIVSDEREEVTPYERPSKYIQSPDLGQKEHWLFPKDMSWWNTGVYDSSGVPDEERSEARIRYEVALKNLNEYNSGQSAPNLPNLNLGKLPPEQPPQQQLGEGGTLMVDYDEIPSPPQPPTPIDRAEAFTSQYGIHGDLVLAKNKARDEYVNEIWLDIENGVTSIDDIPTISTLNNEVKEQLEAKLIKSGGINAPSWYDFYSNPSEEGRSDVNVKPVPTDKVIEARDSSFEKSKKTTDKIVAQMGIEVPDINKLYAELQINVWNLQNKDITEEEYTKKEKEIVEKLEEGYIKALKTSGYNASEELDKEIYSKYEELGLVNNIEGENAAATDEDEDIKNMLKSRKFLEADVMGKKLYAYALYKSKNLSSEEIADKIEQLGDYMTAPISAIMIKSSAMHTMEELLDEESWKEIAYGTGLVGGVKQLFFESGFGGTDPDKDALENLLEEIISTPTARQGTVLGNIFSGMWQKKGQGVPILGSFIDLFENLLPIKNAYDTSEDERTDRQKALVSWYEQLNAYKTLSDPGMAFKSGQGIPMSLAFIGDMLLTRGATSGIKGSIYKGLAKNFEKLGLKKFSKVAFEEYSEMAGKGFIKNKMDDVVTKTLQKSLEGVTHGKLDRFAVRGITAMLTSVPQSLYVGTGNIFKHTVNELLPQNQEYFEPLSQEIVQLTNAASEGSFAAAVFKGWLQNYKEVLSEQTGEFAFGPGLRYLARVDDARTGFIGAISRKLNIKPDAVRRFVQQLSNSNTRGFWDRTFLAKLAKKFPRFSAKNILGTGRIGATTSLLGRIATGKLSPNLKEIGIGGFAEELMEELINREAFLTGKKDPLVEAYEMGGWSGTFEAFGKEVKETAAMLAPVMIGLGGYSRYQSISQRGEGGFIRGIGNILSDVKTNDILHRIKNLTSEEFKGQEEKIFSDINKLEKTDMKDAMQEMIQKRRAWEENEGDIRGEANQLGYNTFVDYIGGVSKQNEIVDKIFQNAYAGLEESQETLINKIKSNENLTINEVITPAVELAETYGRYLELREKNPSEYGEVTFRKKLRDDTKYAHNLIRDAIIAQNTGIKVYDVAEERKKLNKAISNNSLVISDRLREQVRGHLRSAEAKGAKLAKGEKMADEVKPTEKVYLSQPDSNKSLEAKLKKGKYTFSDEKDTEREITEKDVDEALNQAIVSAETIEKRAELLHIIRNNDLLNDNIKKRLTEKIIKNSIKQINKHEKVDNAFIEDITSFLRNIASKSGISGSDVIKALGAANTMELNLSSIVKRNIKNTLGEKGAPMMRRSQNVNKLLTSLGQFVTYVNMPSIRDSYFKYMPKEIDIITTAIEKQAKKLKGFDKEAYKEKVSKSTSLQALEGGIAELEKLGKLNSTVANYIRLMISNDNIPESVKNIKSVIVVTTIEQKNKAYFDVTYAHTGKGERIKYDLDDANSLHYEGHLIINASDNVAETQLIQNFVEEFAHSMDYAFAMTIIEGRGISDKEIREMTGGEDYLTIRDAWRSFYKSKDIEYNVPDETGKKPYRTEKSAINAYKKRMEQAPVGEEYALYVKISQMITDIQNNKVKNKKGEVFYILGGEEIKEEDIWKSAKRIAELKDMGYSGGQAIYYGSNETEYFGQMFSYFLANDALAPPLKDTASEKERGFFSKLFNAMRDWFAKNVLAHLPGPWAKSIDNQASMNKDKEEQWIQLLNKQIDARDLETVSKIFRDMLGSNVYKIVKEKFKDPSETGEVTMQGSYVEDSIEDIFINDTQAALEKIPSNRMKGITNKRSEYNTKGLLKALKENGASKEEMDWSGISDILENNEWIGKDDFDNFLKYGIISESIWKDVGLEKLPDPMVEFESISADVPFGGRVELGEMIRVSDEELKTTVTRDNTIELWEKRNDPTKFANELVGDILKEKIEDLEDILWNNPKKAKLIQSMFGTQKIRAMYFTHPRENEKNRKNRSRKIHYFDKEKEGKEFVFYKDLWNDDPIEAHKAIEKMVKLGIIEVDTESIDKKKAITIRFNPIKITYEDLNEENNYEPTNQSKNFKKRVIKPVIIVKDRVATSIDVREAEEREGSLLSRELEGIDDLDNIRALGKVITMEVDAPVVIKEVTIDLKKAQKVINKIYEDKITTLEKEAFVSGMGTLDEKLKNAHPHDLQMFGEMYDKKGDPIAWRAKLIHEIIDIKIEKYKDYDDVIIEEGMGEFDNKDAIYKSIIDKINSKSTKTIKGETTKYAEAFSTKKSNEKETEIRRKIYKLEQIQNKVKNNKEFDALSEEIKKLTDELYDIDDYTKNRYGLFQFEAKHERDAEEKQKESTKDSENLYNIGMLDMARNSLIPTIQEKVGKMATEKYNIAAMKAGNQGIIDMKYGVLRGAEIAKLSLDKKIATYPTEVMGGREGTGTHPARKGYGEMTIYLNRTPLEEEEEIREKLKNSKKLLRTTLKATKAETEKEEDFNRKQSNRIKQLEDRIEEFEDKIKAFPLKPALAKRYEGGHSGLSIENPNTILHIRYDERIDEDGNKVLHIAEIQGDWGGSYSREGKRALKDEKIKMPYVDALEDIEKYFYHDSTDMPAISELHLMLNAGASIQRMGSVGQTVGERQIEYNHDRYGNRIEHWSDWSLTNLYAGIQALREGRRVTQNKIIAYIDMLEKILEVKKVLKSEVIEGQEKRYWLEIPDAVYTEEQQQELLEGEEDIAAARANDMYTQEVWRKKSERRKVGEMRRGDAFDNIDKMNSRDIEDSISELRKAQEQYGKEAITTLKEARESEEKYRTGEKIKYEWGIGARKIEEIYKKDMPFKKSWQALGFKRMVRMAVMNGFDRITWEESEESIRRGPGEGEKGKIFEYDVLLPQVAKKMTKEHGGQVGRVKVSKTVKKSRADWETEEDKEKVAKYVNEVMEGYRNQKNKKIEHRIEEFEDKIKAFPSIQSVFKKNYKKFQEVLGEYEVKDKKGDNYIIEFGAKDSHFMDITPDMKSFVMSGMRMFKGQGSFYESTETLEEKWERNMKESKTFRILDNILNIYKEQNPDDIVGVSVAKILFANIEPEIFNISGITVKKGYKEKGISAYYTPQTKEIVINIINKELSIPTIIHEVLHAYDDSIIEIAYGFKRQALNKYIATNPFIKKDSDARKNIALLSKVSDELNNMRINLESISKDKLNSINKELSEYSITKTTKNYTSYTDYLNKWMKEVPKSTIGELEMLYKVNLKKKRANWESTDAPNIVADKTYGRYTYFNTLGLTQGQAVYAALLPDEFNRQVIHLYLSNRLLEREVESLGVDKKTMKALNTLKNIKDLMIKHAAKDIGLEYLTTNIANKYGDAIKEVVMPTEQYGDVSRYDRDVFNALDNAYSVATTTKVEDNINIINEEINDTIEVFVERHKRDATATVKSTYSLILSLMTNPSSMGNLTTIDNELNHLVESVMFDNEISKDTKPIVINALIQELNKEANKIIVGGTMKAKDVNSMSSTIASLNMFNFSTYTGNVKDAVENLTKESRQKNNIDNDVYISLGSMIDNAITGGAKIFSNSGIIKQEFEHHVNDIQELFREGGTKLIRNIGIELGSDIIHAYPELINEMNEAVVSGQLTENISIPFLAYNKDTQQYFTVFITNNTDFASLPINKYLPTVKDGRFDYVNNVGYWVTDEIIPFTFKNKNPDRSKLSNTFKTDMHEMHDALKQDNLISTGMKSKMIYGMTNKGLVAIPSGMESLSDNDNFEKLFIPKYTDFSESPVVRVQGSFSADKRSFKNNERDVNRAFEKYGKKQDIGVTGIKGIIGDYLRASGNGFNIKMVEIFEPDKIKDVDYITMHLEGKLEKMYSQPFLNESNRKLFKQVVRNVIFNANNKVLNDHVTGNAQLINARDGIYIKNMSALEDYSNLEDKYGNNYFVYNKKAYPVKGIRYISSELTQYLPTLNYLYEGQKLKEGMGVYNIGKHSLVLDSTHEFKPIKDISSFQKLEPKQENMQLTEWISAMFFNTRDGYITDEMFNILNLPDSFYRGLLSIFTSHKEYIKPNVIGGNITNNYDFNYEEQRKKRLEDENNNKLKSINKTQGSFSAQLSSSEADFIIAIKNSERDIFTVDESGNPVGAEDMLRNVYNKLADKVSKKELTKKAMTQRMRLLVEAWKQGYANARLGGKTDKATKILILEKGELKNLMITPLRKNPENYIKEIKRITNIMENAIFRQHLISARVAKGTFTKKLNRETDPALRRLYKAFSNINLKIFENAAEAAEFIEMSKKKRVDIDIENAEKYLKKLRDKEASFIAEEEAKREGAGEMGVPSEVEDIEATNEDQKKGILIQLINSAAREIGRRKDIMNKNGFFNQDVYEYLTKINTEKMSYTHLREYYEGLIYVSRNGELSRAEFLFYSRQKAAEETQKIKSSYNKWWYKLINSKMGSQIWKPLTNYFSGLGNITHYNLKQFLNFLDGNTKHYTGNMNKILTDDLDKNHVKLLSKLRELYTRINPQNFGLTDIDMLTVNIVGLLTQKPSFILTKKMKNSLKKMFEKEKNDTLWGIVNIMAEGTVLTSKSIEAEARLYAYMRERVNQNLKASIKLSLGYKADEIGFEMTKKDINKQKRLMLGASGDTMSQMKSKRKKVEKRIGMSIDEFFNEIDKNGIESLNEKQTEWLKETRSVFKELAEGKHSEGKSLDYVSRVYSNAETAYIEDYFPIVRYVEFTENQPDLINDTAGDVDMKDTEDKLFVSPYTDININNNFILTRKNVIQALNMDAYEASMSRINQQLFYLLNEKQRNLTNSFISQSFFNAEDVMSSETKGHIIELLSNYYNRGITQSKSNMRKSRLGRAILSRMNNMRVALLGDQVKQIAQITSIMKAMQTMEGSSFSRLEDLMYGMSKMNPYGENFSEVQDFITEYAPEIAHRGITDFSLGGTSVELTMENIQRALDSGQRLEDEKGILGELVNKYKGYKEFEWKRPLKNVEFKELQLVTLLFFDRLAARITFISNYKNYVERKGGTVNFNKPDQEAINFATQAVRETQATDNILYKPAVLQNAKAAGWNLLGNTAYAELFTQGFWAFKSFALNEKTRLRRMINRAINDETEGEPTTIDDMAQEVVYDYLGRLLFITMKNMLYYFPYIWFIQFLGRDDGEDEWEKKKRFDMTRHSIQAVADYNIIGGTTALLQAAVMQTEKLYRLHTRGEYSLTELEMEKYNLFMTSGFLLSEIFDTEQRQISDLMDEANKRKGGYLSKEAMYREAMILFDAWILMHGAKLGPGKVAALPFTPELKRMISAKLKHQGRLERIKAKSQPFSLPREAETFTGSGEEDPFLKRLLGGGKK